MVVAHTAFEEEGDASIPDSQRLPYRNASFLLMSLRPTTPSLSPFQRVTISEQSIIEETKIHVSKRNSFQLLNLVSALCEATARMLLLGALS